MKSLRTSLLPVIVFAGSSVCSATIVTTNWWKLGEDGTLARDYISGDDFNAFSSVGTTRVDNSIFSPLGGSTASLRLTSAYQFMNNPADYVTIPTSNWVFEVSVYYAIAPWDQVILTLGSGGDASQLAVDGGEFAFGQQNGFVSTLHSTGVAVTPGVWANLAWVNDGGTSRVFLNGTQISTSTVNYGFANNDGALTLGSSSGFYYAMNGWVDNLRFSTFAPGQFRTTDLLYVTSVPEPASCGLIGAGLLAGTSMILRRRKALKSVDYGKRP